MDFCVASPTWQSITMCSKARGLFPIPFMSKTYSIPSASFCRVSLPCDKSAKFQLYRITVRCWTVSAIWLTLNLINEMSFQAGVSRWLFQFLSKYFYRMTKEEFPVKALYFSGLSLNDRVYIGLLIHSNSMRFYVLVKGICLKKIFSEVPPTLMNKNKGTMILFCQTLCIKII